MASVTAQTKQDSATDEVPPDRKTGIDEATASRTPPLESVTSFSVWTDTVLEKLRIPS